MANLGASFNPNEVEPDTGGRSEPIPEGRYVLQVTESDVVENAKNTGTILKLTMEVTEGEFKGRKVFENLNIMHDSVQAQEIGQKQLSALCHAAGITTAISDSQDLHYVPFEALVGIEPPREAGGKTYGPRNKINRYIFDGADVSAAPAAKTPPAKPTAAPPARGGDRPWNRNRTAA